MAEKENKDSIKPFKNDSKSCWLRMIHWQVIDGKLILAAGGLFEQAEYDRVYKYFHTKKMI